MAGLTKITQGAINGITIDSSQNVGIGTSSPQKPLHVAGTGEQVRIQDSTNSGSNADIQLALYDSTSTRLGYISKFSSDLYIVNQENSDTIFYTNNTERCRIDSSGNVLVGTTTLFPTGGNNVEGITFQSSYESHFSRSSGAAIQVNRKTNDGDLVGFKKDGIAVGIIGSISGNAMYVNAPNDNGGGFLFSNNASTIYPTRRTSGTVSLSDNTNDLGAAVWRFNDAYITNGVTTGSDQNEKQQIQLLTDSEIAVAKRISKGFKTFKWNSAVEEKGDNARTHTGVIAQEVQQAFSDEGLDAGNYALFMSNTYWEKEISVDAVAEELDEEGNVIVEGKDAYTYIDKKEEATEGYTERTRLGIRYPELLSFVSSAFEQRLTNIETRLTALENI